MKPLIILTVLSIKLILLWLEIVQRDLLIVLNSRNDDGRDHVIVGVAIIICQTCIITAGRRGGGGRQTTSHSAGGEAAGKATIISITSFAVNVSRW